LRIQSDGRLGLAPQQAAAGRVIDFKGQRLTSGVGNTRLIRENSLIGEGGIGGGE
jgi:hypothetical protein